jgi:two-component system chemotaxis sensor kinase CheA
MTEAPFDEIREIFDFVDGLCDLAIEDPASTPTAPDHEGLVVSRGAPDEAPASTAYPPPTRDAVARPAIPPAAEGRTAAQPPSKPTVRVDLDRIDRLVNLVGELVINQAMLSEAMSAAGHSANSAVAAGLDEFVQLTRDIQESVMMIRAQQVKPLFQRMARIVREASTEIGKEVRLVTEGETTEIDKTVIERLADPLTHMIRNAVDHGIDPAEARLAAGKPAEGRISLSASHRSGRVVIEVADDGRGIDRAKVRKIAEAKGLVPPDHALSDGEIDNLLFLPGFSTADTVSSLSGRGVGMDVVKSEIGKLGGRVTIASQPGWGTRFTISLPLTLAVLDGMIVRVENETLVVPLGAINETLSISPGDVRPLGPGAPVIEVRGHFVPLVDLGEALGYRRTRRIAPGTIVLLLAQEDGARAALVVDGIEDQRQVVIKGLQENYGRVAGVAAATILGDGKIALILDPADLIALAGLPDRATLRQAG